MSDIDSKNLKVIFLSVPYCEPYPMVAPVLLSACLNQAGISALGVDFNINFVKEFHTRPWFSDLKNFLVMGHLVNVNIGHRAMREVYKFTKNFLQQLHDQYNPEYIGLSIFTSESLDFGLVLCYMLRKYFPNTKIIAGGKGLEVTHMTNDKKHYHYWEENAIADLIIIGDAESEIIHSIQQNKTGLITSQPQTKTDLDLIPQAEWHSYDLELYSDLSHTRNQQTHDFEPYIAVTASKGCVRRCTFCDVASFWPEFIYRDPIRVADEIIHNYQYTGIKYFRFTDNLINGSISNYRALNQRLVEVIPNTIKYEGYAIFRGKNHMPEDDFRLAAQAGCVSWSVGVESGSEKVRYDMKKKFTNDDIDWSVNALYKYGISQDWLLIVGYPSETEADFEETKKFLRRYAHMASSKKVRINITPTFSLLSNSPLSTDKSMSVEYGLEHNQHDPLSQKFWTSTRYLDNNYPVRSRRWKELIGLCEELGYRFQNDMTLDKWRNEIASLDQIYNDQKTPVFSIRPSK
jgi:radical SAM superfamily enzyme YgiQ (UPF0313 family)